MAAQLVDVQLGRAKLDAQVGRAFAGEGLAFNPGKMARTPNTFDAHRLIWLAGERGVQDAVVEALFKAYFTDGRDLSDRATLAAVAVEAGLAAEDAGELLAGHRGAAEVREREETGRRLGISYRKAWLTIDALNRMFESRVVETHPGRRDGGAELTDFGRRVLALYRSVERRAARASQAALEEIGAGAEPGFTAAAARDAGPTGSRG